MKSGLVASSAGEEIHIFPPIKQATGLPRFKEEKQTPSMDRRSGRVTIQGEVGEGMGGTL